MGRAVAGGDHHVAELAGREGTQSTQQGGHGKQPDSQPGECRGHGLGCTITAESVSDTGNGQAPTDDGKCTKRRGTDLFGTHLGDLTDIDG